MLSICVRRADVTYHARDVHTMAVHMMKAERRFEIMNNKKIIRITAVVLMLACLFCCGICAVAAEDQTEDSIVTTPIVSPALQNLAASADMAVATLCGNDYYFSEDVFARSLNLADVSYITVTSLPDVTEGELLIGSSRVTEGQLISGDNLRMVSYVPKIEDAPGSASFTFSPNGATYDITCHVYLLDQLNYSPTLSIAQGESLCISTHRNFVGYGTLSAYDPEGDSLTYEVVSRPKYGLVIMTDASCGEYVYLPRLGYTGSDSFTYIARDQYGNYSASATVSVQVTAPSVSVVYADMTGRKEYNAALTMAEIGIMQGTELDDKTYFYPEQTVSRVEFLTMAMQAIGIGSVPTITDTGFFDDDAIAAEDKGYVAAAYSLGYVKGTTNDEGELCFLPDSPITRAEAAVILRRMVDAKTPDLTPAFADSSDIPAWAGEAIATLSSLGIMPTSGGAVEPNESMTRGQTAMMLSALWRQLQQP